MQALQSGGGWHEVDWRTVWDAGPEVFGQDWREWTGAVALTLRCLVLENSTVAAQIGSLDANDPHVRNVRNTILLALYLSCCSGFALVQYRVSGCSLGFGPQCL